MRAILWRVIVEAADQSDHHAQFGSKIVEQLQQAAVAGDLADQTMKAIVLFNLPRRVVEFGSPMQDIDLPLQRIARLRGQVARGKHSGMFLHADTQVVDLVDVLTSSLRTKKPRRGLATRSPLPLEKRPPPAPARD